MCKSGQRLMRGWAETCARVGKDLCESGQRLMREWAKTYARVGRDLCESGQRLVREWAETYAVGRDARVDTDFSNNERRTIPSFPCKRESIFSYAVQPLPGGGQAPALRQFATPTALPTRTGRCACENSPHFPPSFPCKRESIFSYPQRPSPAGYDPRAAPRPALSPTLAGHSDYENGPFPNRHSRLHGNPSSLTPYNPSPAGAKPPRYANSPLPPHSPRELAAVPAKTHRISRRHSRANGNPSSPRPLQAANMPQAGGNPPRESTPQRHTGNRQ